jgi:hypothetical protein
MSSGWIVPVSALSLLNQTTLVYAVLTLVGLKARNTGSALLVLFISRHIGYLISNKCLHSLLPQAQTQVMKEREATISVRLLSSA